MRKLLPYFAICFLVFYGCTGKNLDPRLAHAERIMEEYPDSALQILNAIDTGELDAGSIDEAMYALLKTQAEYKNYIDIESDSLITIAVDYFKTHRNDSNLMKSLYYKGAVLLEKRRFLESTEYGMQAHRLSTDLENNFWKAKVSELLTDIFNYSNNHKEALKYSLETTKAYLAAGKRRNYLFAAAYTGINYSNYHNQNRAKELLDSISHIAIAESDTMLLKFSYSGLYPVLYELDDIGGASLILRELMSLNGYKSTFRDSSYYAQCCIANDRLDEAETILRNLEKSADNPKKKTLVCYNFATLYKKKKDYVKALYYNDSILNMQTHLVDSILNQSPSIAQRDYYENVATDKEELSERLKMNMVSLACWCAAVIIIILLLFRIAINKKNAIIANKMMQLVSLSEDLKNQEQTLTDMEAVLSEKDERQGIDSLTIRNLYREKWEISNMIFNDYLSRQGNGQMQKGVMKKIEAFVANMRTRESFSLIEQSVNEFRDGYAERLRKECGFLLSDNEIEFMILCAAGFSRNAICLLQDIRIKHFYNIKYRIGERLARAGIADKDFFLSVMDK